MICSKLVEIVGLECHPLNDDGSVAMLDTPFAFADGDEIPVFVEKFGNKVRFFDDGGAILHLRGRGVSLDDQRRTKFLRNLAEPNGVSLNEMGELEIWADATEAPAAFAKYLATMLALSSWELDQSGVSTDASIFLEEVEICLRAWKSNSLLSEGREFRGVSGHLYKFDFQLDDDAIIAIGTHPQTISSAAKKLLDVRAASENEGLRIMVVIDDRHDADSARREGLVLDSVGSVLMMTRLESNARMNRTEN